MHGYVVPPRIGTLACTTLQLEFSVYSGKKLSKKICKKPEINKQRLKKKRVEIPGKVGKSTFPHFSLAGPKECLDLTSM